MNEIFGLSKKEKFRQLDPNDVAGVEKLFKDVFVGILNNAVFGAIGRAANRTPVNMKYDILAKYFEAGSGTLRTTPDGKMVRYAPYNV